MSDKLTVSGLANRVGVSPAAVRYYERLGLLPRPARSTAGYRLYEGASVARLRFIKGAQLVGLRLRDIGELLEILDRGHARAGTRPRCCASAWRRWMPSWRALDGCEPSWLGSCRTSRGMPLPGPRVGGGASGRSRKGGEGDGGLPGVRLPVRQAPLPVLRAPLTPPPGRACSPTGGAQPASDPSRGGQAAAEC